MVSTVHFIHRPQGGPKFNCSCQALLEIGKNNQSLLPRFREMWGLGKSKKGGSLKADGWMSFIYPLARRPVEIHSTDLSRLPPMRGCWDRRGYVIFTHRGLSSTISTCRVERPSMQCSNARLGNAEVYSF